jgi:hypothetical protein
MDSWAKRLEIAVNIAILCVVIMVAALTGQRFWNARSSSGPGIGTKILLPGVDWSRSRQNLVLALSTTCHFCSESADFYKKLLPAAADRGIPVVAVLPQTPAAGRLYLDGLGVPASEVLQSSLNSIDVAATPTVLVVDATGKIREAWVGKLSPEREQQVMASLH